MEWEDKCEMIRLSNEIEGDAAGARDKFNAHVLAHVKSFDNQAWDMFVTCVNIVDETMRADIEFWKEMYPHVKNMDGEIGFRPSLRLELIKTVCEDDLNIK